MTPTGFILAASILAATATLASAVTYQWDANGSTANLGGAGTWDGTTTPFWDQVGAGADAGAPSPVR